MLKEVEVIRGAVLRAMLCGSRVTCNPSPTDTDQDVIVLVKEIEATAVVRGKGPKFVNEYIETLAKPLHMAGFVCGGSGAGDDEFESWTKGDINLILTSDSEFYDRFVAATTVARRLNIQDKEDRKALFRAVLYSENCYYPGENGLPLAPDDGSPF